MKAWGWRGRRGREEVVLPLLVVVVMRERMSRRKAGRFMLALWNKTS